MRDHLNGSLGVNGFIAEFESSKSVSFLSHPFPECFCRTSKSSLIPDHAMSNRLKSQYISEDECPEWMVHGLAMAFSNASVAKDDDVEEDEFQEDDEAVAEAESDTGNRSDVSRSIEQDEEMDPDD